MTDCSTIIYGEKAKQLIMLLQGIDDGIKTKDDIREYIDVQKADFSELKLDKLPCSISCLQNLEEIDLQLNKLSSLPEEIGGLKNLRKLDLHNNNLKYLPSSIGLLENLVELNLDWNQLICLPDNFGDLKRIERISMIGNSLQELPPSFGLLTRLSILDIQANQLKELPVSFEGLISLHTFDVSENPIFSFPMCICKLQNLKRLGFCKMKIHHFPREILGLSLPFLNSSLFEYDYPPGIYLSGTTLSVQPISIFFQNKQLIEAYFSSEKEKVEEAKVMFLGDGGVGKTYTIKRLLQKGELETEDNSNLYFTTETHGIIISKYKSNNSSKIINFWDFGGQDILFSMHRCFLTDRSCYVVMVGTRTPDPMERARYWFKSISSFAPGSPIILVVNRFSNFGCKGLDESSLKNEFPQLQRIKYLSVKTSSKDEFLLFEKDISEVVDLLDGTGMDIPKNWNSIRKEIKNEAIEHRNFYLTRKQYFSICAKYGLTEKNSTTTQGDLRIWLLEWLNDLGDCFSNHRGKNKNNFTVLNPEWLTNALYLIIFSGKAYTDSGVLSHKFINMILKHPEDGESGCIPYIKNVVYSETERNYILEIMREYQISYPENDSAEFIPALASEKRPNDSQLIPAEWNKDNKLCSFFKYRLKYDYLPEVVLHRFMIVCRKGLKLNLIPWWRSGMRIDNVPFKLTAIFETKHNNEIEIRVYSYGIEPGWKLLQPLKQIVLEISDQLNLKYEEELEVEGSNKADTFNVKWLVKQRNKGKKEVYGEDDDYAIDDLLGMAYGQDNIEAAVTEAKKKSIVLDLSGLSQAVEKNLGANNYYVNINGFTSGTIQLQINNYYKNGFTQEELLKYLKVLPERDEQVPEEFLDRLSEMLYNKSEGLSDRERDTFTRLAEQLSESSSSKKNRLEKLRDWLEDAANVATIVPAVATGASMLSEFLQKELPKLIQNFNSMVFLLKNIVI